MTVIYVCLKKQNLSFLKAPPGHKLYIKLSILWGHSSLDLPSGWSYTFKWATIMTKSCHLSDSVCLGFHISAAWDAKRVVGVCETDRGFAIPLVTLCFFFLFAQLFLTAQHTSHSFSLASTLWAVIWAELVPSRELHFK